MNAKYVVIVVLLALGTNAAMLLTAWLFASPPTLSSQSVITVTSSATETPLGYALQSPNGTTEFKRGLISMVAIISESNLPSAGSVDIHDALKGRSQVAFAEKELPRADHASQVQFLCIGWPFAAHGAAAFISPERTTLSGGIQTSSVTGLGLLPYQPIWLGLAGNLLVYGGVYAALFCLVSSLRNAVRYRRLGKCCVYCAYPLTQQFTVCPECGRPNRVRS